MIKFKIKNLKLKIRSRLSFLLPISLIISAFLIYLPAQTLSAGSIYLSPASATIAKDAYFSVSVRVNASGVDSVQANLSYPADKLDFTGLSYGGTAFEIQAEGSGGGGSIRIARGSISAKSGDVLVATISFRAKVDNGSATVSFTSGTEGVKGGAVVASAGSGGTYSFTKPAPEPEKDKTAPKISDVKITDISLNKATATWITNENATSVVEYGPTDKLGITASSTKLVKSHKVTLASSLLFSGSKYFYRVKSKDKSGNEVQDEIREFKTKGYKIQLSITDKNGNSISDAKVQLVPGTDKKTTTEDGTVEFEDVAAGDHSVHVEYGGQVLASTITVEDTEDPETIQQFTVKIAFSSNPFGVAGESDIVIPVLALIAIVVIVISFVIWNKKLLKHKESKPKEDKPKESPPAGGKPKDSSS